MRRGASCVCVFVFSFVAYKSLRIRQPWFEHFLLSLVVKNAQCGLRGGGLEGKLSCFSALCDVRSVWAWLGSKYIHI